MNRRAFLSTLTAALAGATLDPEMLLWRPGAKTIFLPPAKVGVIAGTPLRVGDVFTIEGVYAVNPLYGTRLSSLQQFVITDNVEAGHVITTKVYPGVTMPAAGAWVTSNAPLVPTRIIRGNA